MRVALVFLAVFVVGIWAGELPEEEKQKLRQVHDNCQANSATHADESLLKQLAQNVENPDVFDHMLCMTVGVGLQEENGQINVDTVRSKISLLTSDKSQIDNVVTKCAVQRETPQKTAVNMWVCFPKNNINYRLKL